MRTAPQPTWSDVPESRGLHAICTLTCPRLTVSLPSLTGSWSRVFVGLGLIVHEDPNARWPSRGAGFQIDFCQEIKLSLNTVGLNTEELPPLPSRWHIVPIWMAKLVSLPIRLAIPIVPILTAPLSPQPAIWGLEALYNCLPDRQDDRKTRDDNSTSANGNPSLNSARPVNLASTVAIESITKPLAGC